MESASLADVTNWLTDDQQRAWRGLIHLTSQLNTALERQLQDDHGISLADYEILSRLHDAPPEGMRVRQLQATLAWEQSRVSHQLGRMQRRGLVERRDCHDDGRASAYVLTDVGRTAIEGAAPGHVEAVRLLLFDHLTAGDVASLATVFDRVNRQW